MQDNTQVSIVITFDLQLCRTICITWNITVNGTTNLMKTIEGPLNQYLKGMRWNYHEIWAREEKITDAYVFNDVQYLFSKTMELHLTVYDRPFYIKNRGFLSMVHTKACLGCGNLSSEDRCSLLCGHACVCDTCFDKMDHCFVCKKAKRY